MASSTSWWEDPFLAWQEFVNPAPKVNGDLKTEVLAKVASGQMTTAQAAPYVETADRISSEISRIRAEQVRGTREAFSPGNVLSEVVEPFSGLLGNAAFLLVVLLVLYVVATGRVRIPA